MTLVIKRSFFSNATFDPHTEAHNDVTAGQLTFFIIWFACLVLWVLRSLKSNGHNAKHSEDHKNDKEILLPDNESNDKTPETKIKIENGPGQEVEKPEIAKPEGGTTVAKNFTPVKPPPTFDEFLKYVIIFGVIMFYFYLCDYKKIFPKLDRIYSRDTFLFLVFMLFLVGCSLTLKPAQDKILNRDQTEEWKGWMQVMFVWYHVFAAKEWYNWIRVYIAAYVWMTGFGNFSFFWIRKDFSLWRFLKMMFRLNFLVACICVVTCNEYVLYYICAMHSYWFISVYVFMGTLRSWNTDSKKMAVKFLAYFLINCIIFEIPAVRDNIFRPLSFLLRYSDPRFDPMHEWSFRLGLDHWACLIGMICAYNYPHYENFIKNVEKSQAKTKQLITKVVLILISAIILVVWYFAFMTKDKYSYNAIHPYTSCIPIICFIVIRNAFPVLRRYHVSMFAWLGKITLETYLSQLHIYLQSNAKDLIGYLVNYNLLNFALSTLIYLPISYQLFNLTTEFSAYLLPKDLKVIGKNAVLIAISFGVPYVAIVIFTHL